MILLVAWWIDEDGFGYGGGLGYGLGTGFGAGFGYVRADIV